MTHPLIEMLVVLVPAVISSIVSWFLARGKYQTEVQTTEIENIEKAIQIWRKTAEDLNLEVIALRKESAELRTEVAQLREELIKYKKSH